ncbi:MAG: hypothetical protein BroJett014_24820 [Planctomycetota bacterium]|nr:MAG: hypothetical protein BroJett014_24820 [Planctomycetota bacterium]
MRRFTFLLIGLLAIGVVVGVYSVQAQDAEPVTIEVNGEIIVLEPGKNISPENYALVIGNPDFAAEAIWVLINDFWEPLAPGVTIPIENPERPRRWPGEDLPVPDNSLNYVLPVPAFSQNDPTWSSDIMQTCGFTIGAAGCALTSTAMVFKYYGASNTNPRVLNTCLGDKACPLYWADAATSCSESEATYVGYWSWSYAKAYSMLQAYRPPIVELTGHYVVVTGGYGKLPSNYRINDPFNGSTDRTLAYYTDLGYGLVGIREYANR